MTIDLAVLAGSLSTLVFVVSVMPMVIKAVRTRDLTSYSLGNLLLANAGNLVHSVYVYSLPAGPIWALHSFYLITTGFMLAMYVRHRKPSPTEGHDHDHRPDDHRDDHQPPDGDHLEEFRPAEPRSANRDGADLRPVGAGAGGGRGA